MLAHPGTRFVPFNPMTNIISSNPKAKKLLHSIQSAFSVQSNPWNDLQVGLGLESSEFELIWSSLRREGVINGVRFQIDPSAEEFCEFLVPLGEDEPEGLIRDRIVGDSLAFASVITEADAKPEYLEYAWPAERWLKVGTYFDLNDGMNSPEELMKPMTERTFFVKPPKHQPLPFSDDLKDQMMALHEPVAVSMEESIWKSIGEVWNITNLNVVREDVSKIILTKRARRFHAAISPEKIGYAGKALIGWNIDPDQVDRAAQALASIRASADVCIRKPTAKVPYNLSAILYGPDNAGVEQIRDIIAEKWSLKPGLFILHHN